MYLHHVFDLWVRHWRNRSARGDVIVTRFADDFVVGFQYLDDARQFLSELRERFAKFNLELHPDKTRLIEFGRFAAQNRQKHGLGKPETFDFLGFTHLCGMTRNGRFWLRRITIKRRMAAKLKQLKVEPVPVQIWSITWPQNGARLVRCSAVRPAVGQTVAVALAAGHRVAGSPPCIAFSAAPEGSHKSPSSPVTHGP